MVPQFAVPPVIHVALGKIPERDHQGDNGKQADLTDHDEQGDHCAED
jgi:hypothetical protein